jgi:hypothetical protein
MIPLTNVDLRHPRQLGYIFMSTIVYAMMVALGGISLKFMLAHTTLEADVKSASHLQK